MHGQDTRWRQRGCRRHPAALRTGAPAEGLRFVMVIRSARAALHCTLEASRRGYSMSVAVVTGASSGIGAAIAIAFAEAGWDVMAGGRDEARLDELADAAETIVTWAGVLESSRGLRRACRGHARRVRPTRLPRQFGGNAVSRRRHGNRRRGLARHAGYQPRHALLPVPRGAAAPASSRKARSSTSPARAACVPGAAASLMRPAKRR